MSSNNQTPAPTVYQQQYEDEISLVDIVKVLLRRKKLILGITALVVCIGLIYAFSSKRVYEVETILFPPSVENIQPLNTLKNNVNVDDVFTSYITNLNSRKLRGKFFNEFKILEVFSNENRRALSDKEKNNFFETFTKALKVKVDKKTGVARVTLEGVHEKKLGSWLDSFIALANKETKNQLVRDLQADIESKIKELKINISSKRFIYTQRRKDELERLQEAFQIAKSLGIHEYNNVDNTPLKNNSLSIYLQDKKRYMQGTKVLQAEINALKNRKSKDVYIQGLRDLEEQLLRVERVNIDINKVQTVIIDKKAVVNIKHVRPKRKLVAILSILLGGMLGLFAVFMIELITKLNKMMNNEQNISSNS